jgi:hypothetical protein
MFAAPLETSGFTVSVEGQPIPSVTSVAEGRGNWTRLKAMEQDKSGQTITDQQTLRQPWLPFWRTATLGNYSSEE